MPSVSCRLLRSRNFDLIETGQKSGIIRSSRREITAASAMTYLTENESATLAAEACTKHVGNHKRDESRVLRDRNCWSDSLNKASMITANNSLYKSEKKKDVREDQLSVSRKRASLMTMSSLAAKYQKLDHHNAVNYNSRTNEEIREIEISAQRTVGKTVPSTGYLCHFCCAKCDNKEELRKHLTLRHSGDGFYTCTICSERLPSYFSMFSLEQHMLAHKSGKGFSCSICDKTFRYERSLRNHMAIHSIPTDNKDVAGGGNSPAPGFSNTYLETDINCNFTLDAETKIPPPKPTENSLFEAVGLKPRTNGHSAVHTGTTHGLRDVIKDTSALETPLLQNVTITHDDTQPRASQTECKKCVVLLPDVGRKQLATKSYKCSKCGRKFPVADRLHFHIIESKCHDSPVFL